MYNDVDWASEKWNIHNTAKNVRTVSQSIRTASAELNWPPHSSHLGRFRTDIKPRLYYGSRH